MEITEVRIKLIEDGGERLHAFCSITLDDSFVVRDLKIIEGTNGPFVAMPSRKLTTHCPQCGMKNHLRSAYCNQCGSRQKEERPAKDEDGRTKLYADIAHPINSTCREMIQQRVIREYQVELKRAKLPGYVSRYDDIDGDVSPPAPRGVIADSASSHVPAPHLAASHAPLPHSAPPHTATPHTATPHTATSHAATPHTPVSHSPKPPSASASAAPLDQPRIQSAEDPRGGLHRPAVSSRSTASSAPQQDGFGAGVFDT
ncbi:MAG TPA: septation protein SpoVG family protein [Pirellulales bacterium]|nr:septation protein SpoVG family protein [Pirellulales bacterium]